MMPPSSAVDERQDRNAIKMSPPLAHRGSQVRPLAKGPKALPKGPLSDRRDQESEVECRRPSLMWGKAQAEDLLHKQKAMGFNPQLF